MLKLLTAVQPWLCRCASLVHGAKRMRSRSERGWLSLGRFRGDHRLGLRLPESSCLARDWAGRDDRAGHMVLGSPAVLLLASDHKDLLAGAGLAKPGDIRGGDVALAVGRGPQQTQVVDPPVLRPAPAARSLAKEHDVLGCRIHAEQQADAAFLVVDNNQVADRVGAEHDRSRGFIQRRLAHAPQGAVDLNAELLAAQVRVLAEGGVAGGG